MKKENKTPNLMIGKLFFTGNPEEEKEPKTLKDFENNIDEKYVSKLSRGNIIPKTKNIEQYIIFDCLESEYNASCSFKLFLYENGEVRGRVNFQKNIYQNIPQEHFKGTYKKLSKSEIFIWGVWCLDIEYKKMRTPVLINLKTTIRVESEYDKANTD